VSAFEQIFFANLISMCCIDANTLSYFLMKICQLEVFCNSAQLQIKILQWVFQFLVYLSNSLCFVLLYLTIGTSQPQYFNFFKGLVHPCHSFCSFHLFYKINSSIQKFIHSFVEVHFCILIALCSVWVPPGCRVKIWTQACRTASQLTANIATTHPNWAKPHLTELRCTLANL
jgi:hypothetical protein